MNLQQIRNATIVVTYAGRKFLIDPMLAEKGTYPPFPLTHNQHLKNPTVSLPVSISELLDVDAVIITHIHLDHLDPAAIEILPKSMKLFVQNEAEANQLKSHGFSDITILSEQGVEFHGIKLVKTLTQHYSDPSIIDFYRQLGTACEACGVLFSHTDEKQLYIMGDTIWCDAVKQVLETYKPDIIVINAGNAQLIDGRYLIMSKEEILKVSQTVPQACLFASHMEAVNHLTLSRKDLQIYAKENGFLDRLAIPTDGESCTY